MGSAAHSAGFSLFVCVSIILSTISYLAEFDTEVENASDDTERAFGAGAQLGMDAAHGEDAEYLVAFVATDPLDPDMDQDGLTDGSEISGIFGFDYVEAEDATEFQAWAESPQAGAEKNFNFFHQTGVTLTADDGSVSGGEGLNISWIRFQAFTQVTGQYRMVLVPNTQVHDIVDLRYESGTDVSNPQDPGCASQCGEEADLSGRVLEPAGAPLILTEGQLERLRQIVENATYLKVRYVTMFPGVAPGTFTGFGVKHAAKVTVYEASYDPNTRAKMRATIFLSMEIDFDLFGTIDPQQMRLYEFELGLNFSFVPWGYLGGDALPADLSLLRILDLDKLRLEKVGLDPYNNDADGDGLADGEDSKGVPWDADADEDGLTDPEEAAYGTDPTDRDTDHDGVRDRVELGLGGDSTGWASIPEWTASQFRGDPHYRPPSTGRYLPNYDADPDTVTDPLNPDSDGDGIPDGWVDGWAYDPSWMIGQIRHATNSTEYLSRAAPLDYNLSYWHQTGVFDSYPQIWEGEDADLDGAVGGGDWSFWVSFTDASGKADDSSTLSFIRKGTGETDPTKEDTDGDGVPEGYEIYYATRDPVWKDHIEDNYYFTPVDNDSWKDVDQRYNDTLSVNKTPSDTTHNQTITGGMPELGKGVEIPAPNPSNVAIMATRILLNLSAAQDGTRVTLEVWTNLTSAGNPLDFLGSAAGLVGASPGWVDFDIDDLWMNFSSNRYYAVLSQPSANITWYGLSTADTKWYTRNATGVWSNATLSSKTLSIRVVDYFTEDGDDLTNLQEYLVGTDPKRRDTDSHTAGVFSDVVDLLKDGDEMIDHTVFRTNTTLGGLVSAYYGPDSWILYDKALLSGLDSDWMFFLWWENVTNPNETFAGSKDRTTFIYTLQDGSELRMNVSAGRLYIYLPGSDFENLVEEVNLTNVTHHYSGTALVFVQANNSLAPPGSKTNALIPNMSDPWLYRFKQMYASDPLDWDTDNDGVADGWELNPWGDDDGDLVPNVRDFDSDNDGLTDGQEMLQVQSDWRGERGTNSKNVTFDPDGDGLYPMQDTDSDGDGIPDAKEVLWSVDTDLDNRINLIDADSDGDGLCDGWCTTSSTSAWQVTNSTDVTGWRIYLPPGMPNGEDSNQNELNEQNESSPIKVDTDGDGLWDGYTWRYNATSQVNEWFLAGVDGAACPKPGISSSFCGENSTYWLYINATAFTSTTNRTNPDTDGDGLTDFDEVHGLPILRVLTGGALVMNWSISDPTKQDTDGDAVPDGIERTHGYNTSSNDTDLDGIFDGTEDRNRDGLRQSNETGVAIQDTDTDGLGDGEEDVDRDGVKDALEPDPLLRDSDGDRIPDGVEFALMKSKDAGWAVDHDTEGDGLSDLNDKDSDNDGLDDSQEDWNRNATIDANETDPYVNDTDGDGLYDGAEPSPYVDSDHDGTVNGRDTNSNNDGLTDDLQVWVVFRTNATNGNYGAGTWVAIIAPSANPYYPEQYNFAASNALYLFVETLGSPGAAGQVQNPYGPTAPPPTDVAPLFTPEGYPVLIAQNGSAYDVFIQISTSVTAKYVKSSNAPTGYSTSNRTVFSLLTKHEETYDGRAAVGNDTDFDGVSTEAENACGTNPDINDSDGDGIQDGAEFRGCKDSDGDTKPDANDTDSDADSIPDNLEDKNFNGMWDAGETDSLRNDTDGDGLLDGSEDANRNGLRDAPSGVFNETSPIDRDSDDDGIEDKVEKIGSWCYVGETTYCGSDNSSRYLDPLKNDTDGDGILDGEEIGLNSAGTDTEVTKFRGDADPATHTDPALSTGPDTDKDGPGDGLEDVNKNGRVDSGEPDPTAWDSDHDGLPDGKVNFGSAGQGACTGSCLGGWWGEDLNLNGTRDQNSDGNWTETDFLANDSDVDGISDGAEAWGRWCYKTESAGQCAGTNNSGRALNATNPDFDGDGLRDGQEIAGWMVGIWYERTMEKKINYSVTSNPKVANSDSDNLTDFEEFMNGSDPTKLDTDDDHINDTMEVQMHSNITGIEGTPPLIDNVSVSVGLAWRANSLCTPLGCATLYTPDHLELHVVFDVSDAVGVDRVTLRVTKLSGEETRKFDLGGLLAYHFDQVFSFGLLEALVTGADVNITAYDTNENGAWGQFHQDSVVEAVAKVVVAYFTAIAKVVVEAASAAIDWIWGAIKSVLRPVFEMMDQLARFLADIAKRIVTMLWSVSVELALVLDNANVAADDLFASLLGNEYVEMLQIVPIVLIAVSVLTAPVTAVVSLILPVLVSYVVQLLMPISPPANPSSQDSFFMAVLSGDITAILASLRMALLNQTMGPYLSRAPTGMDVASIFIAVIVAVIAVVATGADLIVAHQKQVGKGSPKWSKALATKHAERNFVPNFVGLVFGLLSLIWLMTAVGKNDPNADFLGIVLGIGSFLVWLSFNLNAYAQGASESAFGWLFAVTAAVTIGSGILAVIEMNEFSCKHDPKSRCNNPSPPSPPPGPSPPDDGTPYDEVYWNQHGDPLGSSTRWDESDWHHI